MAETAIEKGAELLTRIGEALVGEMPELAHIDVAIGEKGGAFETAFLMALATPRVGHTALLAILAPNYAVKPATLMVNKVTIKGAAQAELMFGPVQAAIAKAVIDSVQERVIPAAAENELLIIASVYIHGNASDKNKLYDYNYEATKRAIGNAMRESPTIDELLSQKDTIVHPLR
jgi:5,6,7,8-tetrahydromethanopterin hydro-lyase